MVQFPCGLVVYLFSKSFNQSRACPASYLMGTADDFPRDKINI
jgi:hypothetical protein